MKERLKELNASLPKDERWTVGSNDPSRRLLALDRNSDPFYSGQGWQREAGEWFGEFHARRIGNRRLHIRAQFYVATGEDSSPVTGEPEATYLPDRTRFEKTAKNWAWFQEASKFARNMGLVDPDLIVDKKRSRVAKHAFPYTREAPGVRYTEPEIAFPSACLRAGGVREASAACGTSGPYDYISRRYPNIIEIWVEKDLDEADRPVLEMVAREKCVNLVVGTGFMTISAAYALLSRTEHTGLPVRILYLSDFDDAGQHMPVSPARHIEFATRNLKPKPDIRLHHLALNAEQVEDQNIPRKIPTTKAKEEKIGRLKNWEARHGVGSVELDTLTDPSRAGWFRALLSRAIDALRDPEIYQKGREAEEQAIALVAEELERLTHWPQRALELIVSEANEISAAYADEREEIRRKALELAELRQALE
jgi:hypothetical protein